MILHTFYFPFECQAFWQFFPFLIRKLKPEAQRSENKCVRLGAATNCARVSAHGCRPLPASSHSAWSPGSARGLSTSWTARWLHSVVFNPLPLSYPVSSHFLLFHPQWEGFHQMDCGSRAPCLSGDCWKITCVGCPCFVRLCPEVHLASGAGYPVLKSVNG